MAAALSSSSRGRGTIVGINVTPMVDIVLVLLIIMMVSATYIVSQSLKVELPKTASSDDTVSKTYVVTISKYGAYFFNDKPTNKADLPALLRGAKAENANLNLVITADEQARHGSVVGVIDLAKALGITKFAINVETKQ
jgi:biopolymer transport protein ExbD